MRREWLEKDYYETLGVDRGATDSEIKKAYRRLAQQHHPDNNPGDTAAETRFKEISEAYATLGDREERAKYDQAREAFASGTFMGGPGGGAQYVRIDDLENLGDLFGGGVFGGLGDLFGFRSGSTQGRAGRDLETEVGLTFHEAASGTTKAITVERGRAVNVKIPAGINDGARIRLRGKGGSGTGGGAPGDLYVKVRVGTHPVFERSGLDLRVRVPISFTEAALGARISAPTLDGKVTLKIPPGTPTGKTFRVSGKGIAAADRTGDMLVTVEVAVPTHLDEATRDLLERLHDNDRSRELRAHLGV
jgi:molecular chaperone DnaJ